MPQKRPLDIDDWPASSTPPRGPPTKRRHLYSSVTFALSSPSSSSTFNTPRTPYPYSHITPSDSPTNPFGRKRALNLILPRATSFSRHLPLRFQLVRGVGGRDKEGVYRVVQVPLSYTFRHVHKLLLFLFGGHSLPAAATGSENAVAPTRKLTRARGRTIEGKGKEKNVTPDPEPGHLFEVQKSITMYSPTYKAGQIRDARTWAKLSSVRDPYRYQANNDAVCHELDVETGAQNQDGPLEEDEEDVWRWEAEEDFTLSHVWPKGGDLTRGITYVRIFTFSVSY